MDYVLLPLIYLTVIAYVIMTLDMARSAVQRFRKPAPSGVLLPTVNTKVRVGTHDAALSALKVAFDAVMHKLDRIEALVDALPRKTPN
jgi:hypothetical protein